MREPLNWIITGGWPRPAPARALRKRLAATTILAVAPFLGYGRQAYAACVPSPAPTYSCSGTSAGESIVNVNNADVSTLGNPAFVVTTDGVEITGNGHIQFRDYDFNTVITNTNYAGTGLRVEAIDADELTPGAVTIATDGTITGSHHGIAAY